MTEKNMKEIKATELNDDALDAVVGGLEIHLVGRRQITTCDNFVCTWCRCKKESPTATSHVCKAQSGMGRHAGEYIEAVFENTCEWCDYRYSCDKAYTWVGLGSPTPT